MKKQDSGQPDPDSPGAPPLPGRRDGPGNEAVREGTSSDTDEPAEGSAPAHGPEYPAPADKRGPPPQ